MRFTRRMVLKGIGGVTLGLPLLESFLPRRGEAQALEQQRFAIFFRQANGVAAAQSSPLDPNNDEPERFWPHQTGALTQQSMTGRAVDELVDHRDRLLILDNINMQDYPFGDGHANGCLQGLTASGPQTMDLGGDSEAGGESIDHRIGVELNDNGNESLVLYVGADGGWLGGPSISHRGAGMRRSAFRNPKNAYDAIAGLAGATPEAAQLLANRQNSINDLTRTQMQRVLSHPRLSGGDRQRLELHMSAIRDVEASISCLLDNDRIAALDGAGGIQDSNVGDDIHMVARMQMDVAALAVACGYTRSVAIQMGDGNDGRSQFRDPDTGNLLENYHFISHRRSSHDDNGEIIDGSDMLHHKIDRQFGQIFKYLIERLESYGLPDGNSLLHHGVAAWYNDQGNGPGHSAKRVPWILAGGAGGFLKQGECIDVGQGRDPNHSQLLNTIASAVGVRDGGGGMLSDFGAAGQPTGVLDSIIA